MQTQLSQLIGRAIRYTADMANEVGSGAITAVYGTPWVSVDVTLSDGRVMRRLSQCSVRGMAEFMGGKSGPQPIFSMGSADFELLPQTLDAAQLAALHAAAVTREANEKAAAMESARAFAAECEKLRAQYPQLEVGKGRDTAARNIRKLLKERFPKIKFSVRQSRGVSSIDVRWTDGPTEAAVKEILSRFKGGHFDGMQDMYVSAHSAWSDTFGCADYVDGDRTESDALLTRALAAAVKKYGTKDAPTLDDIKRGRAYYTSPMEGHGGDYWSWQAIVRRTAAEMEGE